MKIQQSFSTPILQATKAATSNASVAAPTTKETATAAPTESVTLSEVKQAAPVRSLVGSRVLAGMGMVGAAGAALTLFPGVASAQTAVAGTAAATTAHSAAAATAAAPAAANGFSSFIGAVGPYIIPAAGLAVTGLVGYSAWMNIKQMRGAQGGGSASSSSTSGSVIKSDKTFKDVAGIPEAKEQLMDIVDFLKNPGKYARLGAKVPRGALLDGPPGTGKTLLAKAVAGEAGCNFIVRNGSDFVNKYVGVGADNIRKTFEEAKKNLPCVIFIDEIDAIGAQRSSSGEAGSTEDAKALNALLSQMDGFGTEEGIIVLAATNRKDMLDSALTRSGRFDVKVTVDAPNREGREAILNVHAKNKPLANPDDLKLIADRTTGMVGADLENIMNKAAFSAAKAGKEKIELSDMSKAIDDVAMGPERKSRKMDPEEKERTAFHEGGHAMINHKLPVTGTLMKVSILPRGPAMGVAWSQPLEKSMYTKQQLQDMICHLMGGRAAEELHYGNVATGASNDIERATGIATQMITKYGFTEDLGQVTYADPRSREKGLSPSQSAQEKIEGQVKSIIAGEYDRAKKLISESRTQWENLSTALLTKEELDRPEIVAILSGEAPAPTPAPPAPPAGDGKAA